MPIFNESISRRSALTISGTLAGSLAASSAFLPGDFANPESAQQSASLLQKAGVIADNGIIALQNGGSSNMFATAAAEGRIWDRKPKVHPTV